MMVSAPRSRTTRKQERRRGREELTAAGANTRDKGQKIKMIDQFRHSYLQSIAHCFYKTEAVDVIVCGSFISNVIFSCDLHVVKISKITLVACALFFIKSHNLFIQKKERNRTEIIKFPFCLCIYLYPYRFGTV